MKELAEQIARKAHAGQVRKDGSPYIGHVERVVAALQGDELAQTVAWLHDVIEDTAVTASDLLNSGVSTEVVEVVVLLTQKREQPFKAYIQAIKEHPLARKVKVADIIANLNDNPGNKQIVKFSKALISLCGGSR